ncbi:MAG: hypothetical protein ACLP50_22580 [Solirubrobacteraceae bacterium]
MPDLVKDSWDLICDAVKSARADHAQVVIFLTALLTAVTSLNHKLGQLIAHSWKGVSPWLGLVWIGALAIFAVLRAHHVQVRHLRDQLAGLAAAKPSLSFCRPTSRRNGYYSPGFQVICEIENHPGADNIKAPASNLGVMVTVDGSTQSVVWEPEGAPAPRNGTIELPPNGIPKKFGFASVTTTGDGQGTWSCAERNGDFAAPLDVVLTASGTNFDPVSATVRIKLSGKGGPVAELRP